MIVSITTVPEASTKLNEMVGVFFRKDKSILLRFELLNVVVELICYPFVFFSCIIPKMM